MSTKTGYSKGYYQCQSPKCQHRIDLPEPYSDGEDLLLELVCPKCGEIMTWETQ